MYKFISSLNYKTKIIVKRIHLVFFLLIATSLLKIPSLKKFKKIQKKSGN